MGETRMYAHLGRSGLMVSRIGLGTMAFGYTADESTSFDIMDAAVDAGINYFDTADVYGGPQTAGHGEGLRSLGRDHRAVVATQRAP